MASLGRIARLLARVAVAGTLVYVACLLLGGSILRVVTAAASGLLRLVDRPVILTSFSSRGARVVIATYLSGVEQPFATWDGRNLPIFLVGALALALAAPASDGWRRLETVLLAVLASGVTMIATVAIQLQIIAANEARLKLGLRLHDRRGESFLDSANEVIGIAMLLVPAAIFAFAYVRARAERGTLARAGLEPRADSARRAGARRAAVGIAAVSGLVSLAFLGLVHLGTTTVDPRPGLLRVVELNPTAYRARVALSSYDALAALGHR